MSRQLDLYRQRYIQAIRTQMAEKNINSFEDIADSIHTTKNTLTRISGGYQYPTVQQGIDLCRAFGYSANWLFLGKGEQLMTHQATLNEIYNLINKK